MDDFDTITRQVLRNCAISDAKFAGYYSVCGLALRLRDLYKWEKGLEPWMEEDAGVILEWIGAKEDEWDPLAEEDFGAIALLGASYDPFDVEGLNALLEPHGLCYGAGYVHGMKPTFFLARLEEKTQMDGHHVYILGKELARDLLTVPALTQGERIFVRRESARLFLWNQMFFIRKSGREALAFALASYGLDMQDPAGVRNHLTRISDDELNAYLYHELGEIRDTSFDRDLWRDMLDTYPHTAVELLARSLKDILADTTEHGRLRYITRERKLSSLGFYVAFLDGLRKELFPEMTEAFHEFTGTLSWPVIEQAVEKGHRRARSHAESMSLIFQEGRNRNDMHWAREEMERQLLAPLGLGRDQR